MNLRQHKRIKLSLMHFALFGAWGPIGQFLVKGKSQEVPLVSFGIKGQPLVKVFCEAAGIDEKFVPGYARGDGTVMTVPEMVQRAAALRELVEVHDANEDQQPKYTVARKKDREVVGTFDTLELAQAEVDKAKRAKKAALEIL